MEQGDRLREETQQLQQQQQPTQVRHYFEWIEVWLDSRRTRGNRRTDHVAAHVQKHPPPPNMTPQVRASQGHSRPDVSESFSTTGFGRGGGRSTAPLGTEMILWVAHDQRFDEDNGYHRRPPISISLARPVRICLYFCNRLRIWLSESKCSMKYVLQKAA